MVADHRGGLCLGGENLIVLCFALISLQTVSSHVAPYPVLGLLKAPHTSPPADLFIPTPNRLFWEAFSLTVFVHIIIYNIAYVQVLIYEATLGENNFPNFQVAPTGMEPRSSWLRVRLSSHCATVPLCHCATVPHVTYDVVNWGLLLCKPVQS